MAAVECVQTEQENGELVFLWPEDRSRLRGETLDRFLAWAHDQGASRIDIETDRRVMLNIHGRVIRVTSEEMLASEVQASLSHMYRSESGLTTLRGGEPLDFGHRFWPDRRNNGKRYCFRVNASSSVIGPDNGISLVTRPIVEDPLRLAHQHVEPAIMQAIDAGDGFAIISGATGSGKTTLMGGITCWRLEDPSQHVNIFEGSAPTELLYDRVPRINATITQVEVGRDVKTFDAFIRAGMRREPTDIIVQEIRDPASMEAAIQAGISGHRVMASLHTNDCSATIRRAISLCPADQRDSLTIGFVENLRLLVNQRLLPSTDGRRTPIREFVPVTRKMRNALLDAPRDRWPSMVRDAVEREGQSFRFAIDKALREERISPETASRAMQGEQ
ncbi:type IV pilus twitching motility protein PilT [Asaia krungthepensis]|uniref:Twitching motility protein PilT n=1 Tax=Asaia krungthepensis NRIC 0535 TaxID=1307925 RepID=A0ABQ0Q4L0_9PROT|nr:ATPase, T2SS/T4P/T4SS family [Asaia krungthepensis]GBQ91169.1 twitching motility protein PilT [Asaia krungthepensis NRIC 0535]